MPAAQSESGAAKPEDAGGQGPKLQLVLELSFAAKRVLPHSAASPSWSAGQGQMKRAPILPGVRDCIPLAV